MIRYPLIIAAFFAPFFFPWPLALVLGLIAAYFVPPLALLLGVLADVLYNTTGMPYASLMGLIMWGIALLVRRFVKTRIMGG